MSLLSVTELTFIKTLILKLRLLTSNPCVHKDFVTSLLISSAAARPKPESAVARLLELLFRISPGAWYLSRVSVV